MAAFIFLNFVNKMALKFLENGRRRPFWMYINTFPFDRVLSPIDRYRFELTQLVTEIPLFVRPV